MPSVNHPALAAFATWAETFCDLVDRRSQLGSAADFLDRLHPLLPRLYAAGLDLPATGILFPQETPHPAGVPARAAQQPLGQTPSTDHWASIYADVRGMLGAWDAYREVFDPYEPLTESEVTGSIADDVGGIYTDLAKGPVHWRSGETGDALWAWRYGMEIHWGEHVTGALRAINALARNYEIEWPQSWHGAT